MKNRQTLVLQFVFYFELTLIISDIFLTFHVFLTMTVYKHFILTKESGYFSNLRNVCWNQNSHFLLKSLVCNICNIHCKTFCLVTKKTKCVQIPNSYCDASVHWRFKMLNPFILLSLGTSSDKSHIPSMELRTASHR